MKKHYETLGLNAGASKEEIEKKYLELSKKYDPKENDNLEFFKEEYDKVQEAYKALTKSSILKNSDKKPKIKPVSDSTSGNKTESESVENMPIIPEKKTASSENYVFRNALLLFIALGIWGVFMQNMGFFVPSDNFTQKVRVVNTIDTRVNNTVDINIEKIINMSNVFYKQDGRYYLLPTYSPE